MGTSEDVVNLTSSLMQSLENIHKLKKNLQKLRNYTPYLDWLPNIPNDHWSYGLEEGLDGLEGCCEPTADLEGCGGAWDCFGASFTSLVEGFADFADFAASLLLRGLKNFSNPFGGCSQKSLHSCKTVSKFGAPGALCSIVRFLLSCNKQFTCLT